MSADNKSLHRRFVEEVFNQGNLAAVDELVAPDIIDHNAFPGLTPGSEGVKQIASILRAAFPDIHYTLEDEIAEGDKAVVRDTMRGTHRGEFMGIAPTGKQVTVGGMDITRWSNGKIVEHWAQFDTLGLLQQLGVVPPAGQAS